MEQHKVTISGSIILVFSLHTYVRIKYQMTPASIPSPQFVTKPWRCHGTLSSAGCVPPPLSADLIFKTV
jgi:hypothetical protein